MFTNDMVESKMNEITLDEHGGTIDPGSFEMIINFAYSGKVTISTANVQSLMTAASFLMVTRWLTTITGDLKSLAFVFKTLR